MSLEVVCPDGVSEGDGVRVSLGGGREAEVRVPPGVRAGDVFVVEVDEAAAAPGGVDAFVDALGPAMDAGTAALLRAVLQALHDEEALDEFVDEHSEKFLDYAADAEQPLEWGSLHVEYVALVERTIEHVLATARASVDDLYALLEAHREHARGQRFLDKFLSMGDYHVFCGMMHTWSRLETVKAQSRFIDDEQAAIDEL